MRTDYGFKVTLITGKGGIWHLRATNQAGTRWEAYDGLSHCYSDEPEQAMRDAEFPAPTRRWFMQAVKRSTA